LIGCVFSVKCVDIHLVCRVVVSVAAIARTSVGLSDTIIMQRGVGFGM